MSYIKDVIKRNRGFVIGYLLIGIFCAFFVNYKADYFKKVIDGLTNQTIALGSIMFYGILLIVNYCMNYVDEYPSKKLEQGIFLDFKLMALQKISKIDYLEYQMIGTGKLIQRIENGAEAGRSLLCGFWFCLFRQLLPTILFSIYFIWKINRRITYVILGGYVIIFIVTNLLLKCLYQIKEKILTNEEQMNHFLVRGFMEMIVFRMERQFPTELHKAKRAKKEIVNAKVKMNMIHEAFFTIFAVLVALLDLGILIYAWNSKAVSIGSVVALIALIDNAYTPIAIFNVLYVQYKLDKASFRRFEEFLNLKDDVQLEIGTEVAKLTGSLAIHDLSFSYGDRQIFNHLNLEIHAGEKIAFVGESGSGKSTIIKLLAGLIKYDNGSIQIDGQELKDLKLDSLYEHMSYISQDSLIFDGTVSENLVFDRKIEEEKQKKKNRLRHCKKFSYLLCTT